MTDTYTIEVYEQAWPSDYQDKFTADAMWIGQRKVDNIKASGGGSTKLIASHNALTHLFRKMQDN